MASQQIFFSRLLKEHYPHIAREIEQKLGEVRIKPKWLDHTNDIWLRDFMPLQLNETYFAHYTYYPDYLMRGIENIASITNPIRLEQRLLVQKGKVVVNIPLIMDGGNAILTDRHIIMTEKVLVENKRDEIEQSNVNAIKNQLRKKTKLEPLFITWDKAEKYGHSDWLVRYLGGPTNIVLVSNVEELTKTVTESAIERLQEVGGYDIQVFTLEAPTKNSWAYLNYVQIGKYVLMPTVAEEHNDKEAEEKLREFFKLAGQDVEILTIDCQDLIKAGGALHCISWNPHL